MPHVGQRYTLIGFTADLDWRPLRFVEPIPHNRICGACGVVCRSAALLPCMHLLCESCCKQCAEDGARLCPLDGQRCQDRDVDWKDTPVYEILRRQVTCWNEGNGCVKVMAASEVYRHFQRECEHHSVSCPKCSATVIRSDVCAHLRSDCRALVTHPASEYQGQSGFKNEAVIFSCFQQALEKQACEMKAFLERMPFDRGSTDDRLNEICLSINALNETLKQDLTTLKEDLREELPGIRTSEGIRALNESLRGLPELITKSQDSLATSVSVIVASNEHVKESLLARKHQTENLFSAISTINDTLKYELVHPTKQISERLLQIGEAVGTSSAKATERSAKTLKWTKEQFWISGLHVDHCVLFVQSVRALKEAALKTGFVIYAGDKVYLRGYYMSPGVRLEKAGDSVTLQVAFQLHRGDMDDSVPWPFGYKVKLSIVHAVNDAKREIVVTPAPCRKLERPAESSNEVVWYPGTSLNLQDLTRDGYVLYDRLRVKWHLLL